MSNVSKIIIILAVLTAIMPYLGFPAIFKNGFVLVASLTIAGLLYLKEKHMLHMQQKKEGGHADTFVENGQHAESGNTEQEVEDERANT